MNSSYARAAEDEPAGDSVAGFARRARSGHSLPNRSWQANQTRTGDLDVRQQMPFHALRQFRIDLGDLVQTRGQDLDRPGVLAGGKQNDRQRDPSPRSGSHITRELDRATQICAGARVAGLHLGTAKRKPQRRRVVLWVQFSNRPAEVCDRCLRSARGECPARRFFQETHGTRVSPDRAGDQMRGQLPCARAAAEQRLGRLLVQLRTLGSGKSRADRVCHERVHERQALPRLDYPDAS